MALMRRRKGRNTLTARKERMKDKQFMRIKCYNHKFPFEHIVGWTTEFEDTIYCDLCRKEIYNPFLTGGSGNTKEFIFTNLKK